MGHDHTHGIDAWAGARHRRRLWWAFALTLAFLAVEAVVGLVTSSLAVLSDAGHMATDALGLGIALAAISAAGRTTHPPHRTFGLYRLEILAALANAVVLFGVAGYVIVEAFDRLDDPPDVAVLPVLVVGVLGLVVNAAAFALLRQGARESLNVRGAYFEVMADALGSLGVIVAAVVMGITGWGWVDPVIGAAIGLFILPRAWAIGRDAVRVLVQAAPAGVDVAAVTATLVDLDGVSDVHDLHLWTLTSGMDVLTAHLGIVDGADAQAVLDLARRVLADRFGLSHATLQIEQPGHHGCAKMQW